MQSVVIDTNIYTAFMRGDKEVKSILDFTHSIYLPVTVLGELYYGFHKGDQLYKNEALLKRFLAKEKVGILEVDGNVAEEYGKLKDAQRRSGVTLASNDLWIAAICIQNNLPLYSFDKDFDSVQALDRVR